LPSRLVIDLAPPDGELDETAVLEDGRSRGDKVALITIEGFISSTPSESLLLAGAQNPVDGLLARLDKAADDPRVRAVVLRVNSPGGTVAASETMYEEIAHFRGRTGKPVVVSMGEVATSGGYYVALAGDEIMAQPATVTGSIGVLIQTFNVATGLSRIGVDARAVVSGENKALASPVEPPDPEHFAILQQMVDEFYAAFRSRVVERRPGLDASRLDELTDGRVVTGATALDAGLIDGLGGVRDAFERAKAMAGIDAAALVTYHPMGVRPNTPYATVRGPVGGTAALGPARIDVDVLDLGGMAGNGMDAGGPGAPARFLYVWWPAR
jgi:protease-4